MDNSTPGPRSSCVPTQSESVRDPTRIAVLLQRLVSNRCFVSVTLQEGDGGYDSTILEVDSRNGEFLLDELFPLAGNHVLRQRRRLRLYAAIDSFGLTFASEVRGEGKAAGIRYFRVRLPECLDYAQRRRRYRVALDETEIVPIILATETGTLSGILHDVSAIGLGIRLERPPPDSLRPGDTLRRCVVRIPDEAPIVCALELRDVRKSEAGASLLGARFLGLDPAAERRIERFVASADRRGKQRQEER